MLGGYVVKLVSITALYVYMYMENQRRDRMSAEESDGGNGIENGMLVSLSLLTVWHRLIFQDQTEIDNKQFRYVL